MARRALAVVAALLVALAASGAVSPGPLASASVPAAAAAHPAAAPPTTEVGDNPFIPPDKDLSTCVSATPQPGCGSSAHGGWRQFLTFVIVVLGLAFIGWRIVVTVRRSRRQLESSGQR